MDKSDLDVDMDKSDGVAESREDEDYIRYLQELRDNGVDDNDAGDDPPNHDGDDLEDDIEDDDSNEPLQNRYLQEDFNADYMAEDSYNSAQRVVGTYVRVVHTNGIHNIAMISCQCHGHDMLPCDLIAARLLPASFE
jgi:hypothetical protein